MLNGTETGGKKYFSKMVLSFQRKKKISFWAEKNPHTYNNANGEGGGINIKPNPFNL